MPEVNDHRPKPAPLPWGYVVFTDSFMSGWGGAAGGRSLYALAVANDDEALTVLNNGKYRSEMKRGRIVTSLTAAGLPRLRMSKGDHLSISNRENAARWYKCGGWA